MSHVLGDEAFLHVGDVEVLVDHAHGQIAILHLLDVVGCLLLALEHAPGNVTAAALAPLKRILVVRRNSKRVGDHRRLDPVAHFLDKVLEVIKLLLGGHEGRAARDKGHDVRHLATQQR